MSMNTLDAGSDHRKPVDDVDLIVQADDSAPGGLICGQMALPTPPPPAGKYGIYHQFKLEAELARTQLEQDDMTCVECISTLPKLTFSFVYLLLVLVGIVGNGYLLKELLFCRRQQLLQNSRRRSCTDTLPTQGVNSVVLVAAICDLGYLITSAPDLAAHAYDRGWIIPAPWSCSMLRYGQQIFMNSSIMLQLLCSFERYMVVRSETRTCRIKPTYLWLMITTTLLGTSFSVLPYAAFQHSFDDHMLRRCGWSLDFETIHHLWYRTTEYGIYYLIPLLTLFAMTTHLAAMSWISRIHNNDGQPVAVLKTEDGQQLVRLRHQVLLLIFVRLVVFTICFSPAQLRFMSEYIALLRRIPGWLNYFMNSCVLLHCVANPIIYARCCRYFTLVASRGGPCFWPNSDPPKLTINVIPPSTCTQARNSMHEMNGGMGSKPRFTTGGDDVDSDAGDADNGEGVITTTYIAQQSFDDELSPISPDQGTDCFMPLKCSTSVKPLDTRQRRSTTSSDNNILNNNVNNNHNHSNNNNNSYSSVSVKEKQRTGSFLNKLLKGRKTKSHSLTTQMMTHNTSVQPARSITSFPSSVQLTAGGVRKERKTMASIVAEGKKTADRKNTTATGRLRADRYATTPTDDVNPMSRASSYLSIDIESLSVSGSNLE